MPRQRGIAHDYANITGWLPYYEARGDTRSVRVVRLHQSQVALEMALRLTNRDYHTQRESLDMLKLFDPALVHRDRPQAEQVDAIRRTQRKAVLYTSKVPGKAPSGALFWTRQGRVDIGLEKTVSGDNWLALFAGGLALVKGFNRDRDIWSGYGSRNTYQVVLHSGVIASRVAKVGTGMNFNPDERDANLVIGAANIQSWLDERSVDGDFAYVAERLAAYADKQPLSDKVPAIYDMSVHKSWRTLMNEHDARQVSALQTP